jgi:hypothetical protein
MDQGLLKIWDNFTDKLYNYVEDILKHDPEKNVIVEHEDPSPTDDLENAVSKENLEEFKDLSKQMKSEGKTPCNALKLLKLLIKKDNYHFLEEFKKTWPNSWKDSWAGQLLQEALIYKSDNSKKFLLKQGADPTNCGNHDALKYYESLLNLNPQESINEIKTIIHLYPERYINEIANDKNSLRWNKKVVNVAQEYINVNIKKYGPQSP